VACLGQLVHRRQLTAETRVLSKANVGFVVDSVLQGQDFLRVFMCAAVSYLFLQCSVFFIVIIQCCELFTEVPLVYHPQCQGAQFHAELRNKNLK